MSDQDVNATAALADAARECATLLAHAERLYAPTAELADFTRFHLTRIVCDLGALAELLEATTRPPAEST